MKAILSKARELDLANAARLRRLRPALAAVLAALVLTPMDFPIPLTNIMVSSIAWVIIGLFVIVLAVVLSRGRAGTRGAISKGWGYVIAGVGVVLALAAIATLPATTTGPATVGGGQMTLGMQINPSVDTTASYPAGSYTACTSATLTSGTGGKTAVGAIWAAMSAGVGAVYNQGPGNSGTFIEQTGAQTAVTGGGGKMSHQCFQMKFVFQYSNVPTASGGGAIGLPIYIYWNSYSESSAGLNINPWVISYYNGSLVNTPVFPSNNGLSDFPFYLKDGAGNWNALCPNFRGQNFGYGTSLQASSCAGFDANLARSTGQITFTLDVLMNLAGPFGYSTTSGSGDSPVGSSVTFGFSMGLPCALTNAGLGNACTPTLASYQLVLTRSTS